MFTLINPIFYSMVCKDIEHIVGMSFQLETEDALFQPFRPSFDTSYIVEINKNTVEGTLVFHCNFDFLTLMFKKSEQASIHSSQEEIKDFGREITNIIGGKLIEFLQLKNIHIGIPQYISQKDQNVLDFIPTKGYSYYFKNKLGSFMIFVFLNDKSS